MSTQPKRLTLSEILEMVLTRSARDQSSVSIGRTSSGEVVWDVKVYATEDETAEGAAQRATEIHDTLAKVYAPAVHENAKLTLARNAKGETLVEVEARTNENRPTLEQLALATIKEYDRARTRYPMEDGRTAKPGSVA